MKMQLLLSLAAAVVGGVAGAIVVGSGESEPISTGPSLVEIAALENRLDDLARQNDRLQDQIDRLEVMPSVAEPVRAVVDAESPPTEEQQKIAAMLRELQQAKGGASLPENFTMQVGAALEQIRAQEDKEREEQRQKARDERFERQLTELAQKLGMDAYQTNEMRTALNAQTTKFEDARELIRDTGDWTMMRESMQTIRDETNAALAQFLTPSQLTQFQESEGGRGGIMGGGMRGGRGGGGGPGGGGAGGGGRGR